DGEIMDLMSELHKDNSGYDLRDLLIGAEGTLGIITAAVLKLVPMPRAYATAMVAATSLPGALGLLNELQAATGNIVEAFEFMPQTYMKQLGKMRPDLVPPLGLDRDITILLELGSSAPRDFAPGADGSLPLDELLETTLDGLMQQGLISDAAVARTDSQRQNMWAIREVAAEISIGRQPIVDTDIAVALDKVPQFLSKALERLEEIDPGAETITVSHLGDGNLHFAVWPTSGDAALMRDILKMVEDVTVSLGGTFSAEHGIGLSKLGSMRRHKDPVALAIMGRIKQALDPNGIMNPGKVVP
ncbi:MAG: FAD-binding oxidoreductase, partial [Paracoccaceae bacterium]